MKSKLVIALIAAGMFSQVNSAEVYVDNLDEKTQNLLLKSLENEDIEKSPKVALATGPKGGREAQDKKSNQKKNLV